MGVSTIRFPIGSVAGPSTMARLLWKCTFGTVWVSVTWIQGFAPTYGTVAKYSAAACSSSSVMFLANAIIDAALPFFGSELLRFPSLKSFIVWTK